MIFLQFKVKGDALSLNPRAGERAVLIKNKQGDWGIVTGKWTDFKRGVAGVAGKRILVHIKFITNEAFHGSFATQRAYSRSYAFMNSYQ